jgi:NOTCH protein
MKASLGEEGTEQFTATTRVNGEVIAEHKIHDPFIRSTTTLKGWKHAWKAMWGGIRVQVSVDASHGAMRAIMTLDPNKLQEDSEQFLRDMATSRERNAAEGIVGYCNEPA